MSSARNQSHLSLLITDILCGGDHIISGVQKRSASLQSLFAGITEWGYALDRQLEEITAVVEPCIRQSILMSLLPKEAFDPNYTGSYDDAISNHLSSLGLSLGANEIRVLRDVIINASALRGLNSTQARNQVSTMADLRGRPSLYREVMQRQNGRCIWCGVLFGTLGVHESLEHVSPKHLGGDAGDGSNWGISCISCNSGKADSLAWAAQPEAHDYVRRTQFDAVDFISLQHRWAVLMRSPHCAFCQKSSLESELVVYKRIPTGLPIPSHCDTACTACAAAQTIEVIAPLWNPKEMARAAVSSTPATPTAP